MDKRTGSVSVEVDTKKLNDILKKLPGNRDKAVRAIAFSIEGKTKRNITRLKLVDTGAMLNSVYTRTAKGSYVNGQATGEMPELPGEAQRQTLPSVKEGEAVVGPTVEYAIYHEFGTRYITARPFLVPAVNEAAKELAKHFKGVCDGSK